MEWRKTGKKLISALLPPAFWLGAWQLCAFLVDRHVQGRGNELLLPYPATVLAALVWLAGTSAFWGTVAATLGRILAGMALGTALGMLLAVQIAAGVLALVVMIVLSRHPLVVEVKRQFCRSEKMKMLLRAG